MAEETEVGARPRGHFPLTLFLATAIGLGVLAGEVLGPRASAVGALGPLVIKLLKALATPLIFFAIVDALLRTEVRARSGLRLLAISGTNALVAGAIGLALVNLVPLGRAVSLETLEQASRKPASVARPETAKPDVSKPETAKPGAAKPGAPEAALGEVDLAKVLERLVPGNVLEPFVENSALGAVLLALLFGLALRKVRASGRSPEECAVLERAVAGGFRVVSTVLEWVVWLVPLAAFGVIAATVGKSGLRVFETLGAFVLLVTAGLALHALVYYALVLSVVARRSPRAFFGQAAEALLTAFSCGSSLATLPVTLRTLSGKMRVSDGNARLAACVGTNLNHDGILLYEAVAALFVAQVYGIPLGTGEQIQVLATSALAAVGIAGVPDAGLITLSLVLASAGLPLAAAPLLLPVDWLLGRLRATVNVASDLTVANVLERFEPGGQ